MTLEEYIEDQTGYKCFTTFITDFEIADAFGLDAIRDTYNRAFKEWKSDYKYLTELVMILNWQCARHYGQNRRDFAMLYADLYNDARDYAIDNLKGAEFSYFWKITD